MCVELGASSGFSSEKYTASRCIASGGDVVIQATGDGQGNGGNLAIIGSQVEGNNVTLAAANDLLLRSQQQVSEQVEKSKSSSGEIGMTVGSEAGIGVYVAASASKGMGQSRHNATLAWRQGFRGG